MKKIKYPDDFVTDEKVASLLWKKYSENPELKDLEIQGLLRGFERGKIMDVPLEVVIDSLKKQWDDFLATWTGYKNLPKTKTTIEDLKRALADLRNVAGIIFIKLKEGGDKKE